MFRLFCLEIKLRQWVEKKSPVVVLLLTRRRTSESRNEPVHVLRILKAEIETKPFEGLLLGQGSSKGTCCSCPFPSQSTELPLQGWQPSLTGEWRQLRSSPIPANYPDSQGLLGDRGEGTAAQPPGAAVISWCNEEWGKERSWGWSSAVLSAISCSEAPQNNALLSLQ